MTTGTCSVCAGTFTLKPTDGTIRTHGPHRNRCLGSNRLPVNDVSMSDVVADGLAPLEVIHASDDSALIEVDAPGESSTAEIDRMTQECVEFLQYTARTTTGQDAWRQRQVAIRQVVERFVNVELPDPIQADHATVHVFRLIGTDQVDSALHVLFARWGIVPTVEKICETAGVVTTGWVPTTFAELKSAAHPAIPAKFDTH
jgi:hypothetical protein